jgi:hypothetical protein
VPPDLGHDLARILCSVCVRNAQKYLVIFEKLLLQRTKFCTCSATNVIVLRANGHVLEGWVPAGRRDGVRWRTGAVRLSDGVRRGDVKGSEQDEVTTDLLHRTYEGRE